MKIKIGAPVMWLDESGHPRHAVVVRHGRDSSGVYTEIEVDGLDENKKVHRSQLRADVFSHNAIHTGNV